MVVNPQSKESSKTVHKGATSHANVATDAKKANVLDMVKLSNEQRAALNLLQDKLSPKAMKELSHTMEQFSVVLRQATSDIINFCSSLALDKPIKLKTDRVLEFADALANANSVLEQLQSLHDKDLDKITHAKDQKGKAVFLRAMQTICDVTAEFANKTQQYETSLASCEKQFSPAVARK